MAEKEFRHIVRIANTDVDGNKTIYLALQKIKGVGFMFSNAVLNAAGISKTEKTGYLSDQDAARLGEVIKAPEKFNIPSWLYNRRKDYESGEDMHLITSDLTFVQQNDKKRLQKIKSYRGLRLSWGLPVRGQRTQSNFRRNKGKVSGTKKKTSIRK